MTWTELQSKSIYEEDVNSLPIHTRSRREAQKRNRIRHRLLIKHSMYTNEAIMTEEEINKINLINSTLKSLVDNWADNSKKLGFNLKPFVCEVCNKRSAKEHLIHNDNKQKLKNYCKKCYDRFNQ